jgi:hypothetical protein
MGASAFQAKQEDYRMGVALTAGVELAAVAVNAFADASTRKLGSAEASRGGRVLLGVAVKVDTSVTVSVIAELLLHDIQLLNRNLNARGLPMASVTFSVSGPGPPLAP